MNWIEEWAPLALVEDWDNSGLLVGAPDAEVSKALVTLEITPEVAAEAIAEKVQLIVSHHPLLRDPLSQIRFDVYPASLIAKMIRHDIAVYAAHTNLDAAPGGINDLLAERLGLEDVGLLAPTREEKLFKLAVFVPLGYEDNVRQAMCAAGAGWIGAYSECTFQSSGTGTFRPLEGTNPFLGKIGALEKADESRIETIVPEDKLDQVVQEMCRAHPYEEVAYDLYPLRNRGKRQGLGRVGRLPAAQPLSVFAKKVKTALDLAQVRVTGLLDRPVSRAALCGGSAMAFLPQAVQAGADVYITGDVKHHDALHALAEGIALIDAGHHGTERVIVPVLTDYLKAQAEKENCDLQVLVSQVNTDPFRYL